MRFGKYKGFTSLNGKRRQMEFPPAPVVVTPDPDPIPDPGVDEAAFVAAMRALPEVHHNHQWMDGSAGSTSSGSAYYANYGPGHSQYGSASNYATPVVGNLTENEAMYRLVPRGEATHVAVANGLWSAATTWNTRTIPGAGAKVLISQGKTVTYDVVSANKLAYLRVDGILNWKHDINTQLVVEDWFVDMMGTLRIGTAANPIQADKTAVIQFLGGTDLDLDRDPLLFGRGLLCEGLNEIMGAYKTPYVRCAVSPMAGNTTITLDSVPTGWRIGDAVYIPQTSWRGNVYNGGPWLSPWYEHRTIAGATPNSAGVVTSATITLSAPLSFDHDCQTRGGVKLTQTIGGKPTRPHLVNLTRNVVFETPGDYWETAPHQVGHLMWMHNDFLDVQNFMVKGMGRTRKDIRSFSTIGSTTSTEVGVAQNSTTYKQHPLDPTFSTVTGEIVTTVPHKAYSNVQGRYPIHLHRAGFKQEESCPVTGDTICACNKATLKNVVAWNTMGWAFAHHSSNADFYQCIGINAWGTTFMAEAGDEAGSWDGCFAGGRAQDKWIADFTEKEGRDVNFQDLARNGSGFWMNGRNVKLRNCIATATKMSYVWEPRKAPGKPVVSLIAEPIIAFNETPFATTAVELPIIAQFDNCCAYGAQQFSIVTKEGPSQGHGLRTVWKNPYGWGITIGIVTTYTGKYTFIGPDFVSADNSRRTAGTIYSGEFIEFGHGFVISQNSIDQVCVDGMFYGFDAGVNMDIGGNTIPGLQSDVRHATVNITVTNCRVKFRYTIWSQTAEAFTYIDSNSIPTTWANYETFELTPGRLSFTRDASTSDYIGYGFTNNGVMEDALGSRRLEQAPDLQYIDGTVYATFLGGRGYYTNAGNRIYLVPKIVSDRLTGDYIKFDLPIIKNDGFNGTKDQNLGPLPAKYIPQIAAGYTWTADVNAQRYAHDFTDSVLGTPIPPIIP